MVISKNPVVLGNMPESSRSHLYEKVAFMGQVPVKVSGPVNIGDYIIPSGNNDGLGIAVNPSKMNTGQYKKIIGVAWARGNSLFGYSMVNVAIGINPNSIADKIEAQDKEINTLKNDMNMITSYLKSKDPSFKVQEYVVAKTKIRESKKDEYTSEPDQVKAENSFDLKNLKTPLSQRIPIVTDLLAHTRRILDERGIKYNKFQKIKQMLQDPC